MKFKKTCLFLILVCLLSFAGCGRRQVSKNDIINDLQYQTGNKIESLSINNRRTSNDNETDEISVTVNASNNDRKGEISYDLVYKSYQQGWELNSFIQTGAFYSPLRAPEQNEIKESVKTHFGNSYRRIFDEDGKYIDGIEDIENNKATYLYYAHSDPRNTTQRFLFYPRIWYYAVEMDYDCYEGKWYCSKFRYSPEEYNYCYSCHSDKGFEGILENEHCLNCGEPCSRDAQIGNVDGFISDLENKMKNNVTYYLSLATGFHN